MAKPWLMGIDLGGGGARCVLFNRETGQSHSADSLWQFTPAPGTFGTGFDLPTATLWRSVGMACRSAVANAECDPTQIAALSVSALRFSTAIVDHTDRCIFSMPNNDARAAGECFEIAEQWGQPLLRQTGAFPLPLHAHARLLWLKNHSQDQFSAVNTVYSLGDWLNEQLCGARATEISQASASGVFRLDSQEWAWELIDSLGLNRDWFPPIVVAGTPLGRLEATAAEHLGLTAGICVGMGGGDTQCSLLGATVLEHGDTAAVGGTTAPVQVVLNQPLVDTTGACQGAHHIVPGRWVLESNSGPMGFSVSFMAKILYPEASQPERLLFAEAALSKPGAAGMLSTLGAQVMDMAAPTLPVGQLALSHMTCTHESAPRQHLARAMVEGCAAGLRANLAQLQRALVDGGLEGQTSKLTFCGGLSRSDLLAQLLADISGREVTVPDNHLTSALGAVVCASVSNGDYADLPTAARSLNIRKRCFSPEDTESYQPFYANWDTFRQRAQDATAPAAADHILPIMLTEPERPAVANATPAHTPAALISAAFDAASLAALREYMSVEYASFREVKRLLTGPTLVEALSDKQIFVTEVDIVDADALQQLPNLRVVAACRGDAVNVDVDACTAFGIPVLFAPGRNAIAVADLTVAFILSLARKLPAASTFLQQDDCSAGNMGKMGQAFSQLQGTELWGKTIGLVGMGAVGRAVATRLQGFDVRILVADPFIDEATAIVAGCERVELQYLLQQSDFVSLHAAVTPKTTGMIGEAEFAAMQPHAFFINTARAALIDEEALIAALTEERLAGAALDTFAVEPPGFDHPLVGHPAVITTPHSAGNTREVAAHQGATVSEGLLQLLSGEKPRNVLNPETLESFSWERDRPSPSAEQLAALKASGGPAVSDLQRDAKAKKAEERNQGQEVNAPMDIVDKMTAILEAFCQAMACDDAVIAFSQGQDVTLHFTVLDLGLEFYISLQNGTVASEMGPPDSGAEVQLEMRAEILDGMFAGTIDTMECAMNGEISFMGDAAKAMTLQHMNQDMERLYKAAREDIGDPGDLSAIARLGENGSSATPVESGDVRTELVTIMQELYEAQVITATGGNISVRIPDTEDEVWITPSRLFKGDLKPEVLVRINLQGESLDRGARSPSSEWCMHTRIMEVKSQANAVIHAHAPNATILANAGLPFLPISTEAAFFGNIPRIPFTMPGTPELADAVAEAMQDEWAVLLINHGIIVGGRSLRRAADMVEIIERTAEVILGCYAVGKEPPLLPAEAVEHFRKMGDIVA
ncbi:MAG: NAD(P)-dependent oxidoreductase [Pseudomonadota bacterium]